MKSDFSPFAFASRLADRADEEPSAFAALQEDKQIAPLPPRQPVVRGSRQPARLAALPKKNSRGGDLFHYIEPTRRAADIVLDTSNFTLLSGVVEEYRRGDDIRRFGLKPRSKLLFCGPPGCGKTLCAEVMAFELKLPLVVARLDSIITTFLGETASNLRQLFEAASSSSTVLFLDEFDALGRTRNDASENSEIRRVVNSMLMLIDEFKGRGMIIAATNMQNSIDSAAWRRFDEVILFSNPARKQISRLLDIKTRNFKKDFELDDFLDELDGMSYAEVERVCVSSIKREIMSRNSVLRRSSFSASIREERRRISIRNRLQG